MSSKADIKGGLEEMDYDIVDNGVLKLPSSKPAAFAWTVEPTPDEEALEHELDEYDFGLMMNRCETREDGQFYCHFDVVTDHYKRVKVKTWNDSIRVFPDDELPDTYELVRIIKAAERAFGAELEHDPIDDNDT